MMFTLEIASDLRRSFGVGDLVDAGDLEAVALRGELEEAVQSGRAVAAWGRVQAHGKAAPGWVLSASNSGL
jgi:hypothetical protein